MTTKQQIKQLETEVNELKAMLKQHIGDLSRHKKPIRQEKIDLRKEEAKLRQRERFDKIEFAITCYLRAKAQEAGIPEPKTLTPELEQLCRLVSMRHIRKATNLNPDSVRQSLRQNAVLLRNNRSILVRSWVEQGKHFTDTTK